MVMFISVYYPVVGNPNLAHQEDSHLEIHHLFGVEDILSHAAQSFCSFMFSELLHLTAEHSTNNLLWLTRFLINASPLN